MNEQVIRHWFDVFKNNQDLTEIRIVGGATKKASSGYFTDADTLIKAIKPYDNCGLYFTLNEIDPACYGRVQRDKIDPYAKSQTSDKDIIGRTWCLIDIDCEKPSDTNSTDEEKDLARPIANKVYAFLRDQGFEAPVVCDSGNGFHLLYRQALANTPENNTLMEKFLKMLSILFSTDKAKVDTSVFNASRICKLYGTYSRKGSDTPERPQRESFIMRVPPIIKETPRAFFEKVVAMLPEEEKPSRFNQYRTETFDLDAFIAKHNIKIHSVTKNNDYKKYVLEECPFNSSHSAPDSAIFQMNDGSIGFKCLHSSCSQYTWKDVRMKFEPDAYSRSDFNEYRRKSAGFGSPGFYKEVFKPREETEEKGKKWLSMSDIEYIDTSKLPAIPTGFAALDRSIMGLLLGDVSIVSGSNASGKSSWLNCVALNAINKGWKTAIWSGELVPYRLKGWINQTAAGKSYVSKKDGYDNFYYAPKKVADVIDRWSKDRLYLYNNEYGSRWEQLVSDITNLIEKEDVKLIIIDNLMCLQLAGFEGDKNEKETAFINEIKSLAKSKGVHIILVAHPRKQVDFLRKDSIAGSGNISNLVDNVFIIHRVNMDFEMKAKAFFGERTVAGLMQYGNVIEVCKEREHGVVDLLVGMYYEIETRRFKNDVSEHIVYGWAEEPKQMSISESDDEADYSREYDDDSYSYNNFGSFGGNDFFKEGEAPPF